MYLDELLARWWPFQMGKEGAGAMTNYQPELGQAAFGASWQRYEMPEFAIACFEMLWREIARVFSNRFQADFSSDGYDDPEIDGITVRGYCWVCGCEDEEHHRKDCPSGLPNFEVEGVAIHWYKHPGRGMSCDVDWTPAEWADWFDRVLARIRAADVGACGE